jgi:GT2 family glycosyltransferase
MRSSIISECEVVIVDDGENGDLDKYASNSVKIMHTKGHQGPSVARNLGAAGFFGQILVFLDADVEVEETAIESLCAPIKKGIAEATVGNYSFNVKDMNFTQKYKQTYISKIYSRTNGYIRNTFWTALSAIKNSDFNEIGGFKCNLLRQEDAELGIRLTTGGKRILSLPDAVGKHLKCYDLYELIRNDLHKGISGFSLALRRRVPITDGRHSSARDIVAVITSYCLILYLLIQLLFSLPFQYLILFLPLIITVYLLTRSDMLPAFRSYGISFFVRAIILMYFMDIIRGLCVILGTTDAVFKRCFDLPRKNFQE